jgi:DNA-binding transcriptional regulator YdaS (Cro superfamily)
MTDPAIEKIRAERGLATRIAEACGIDRAAVYQWKRVPPGRVHTVAPIIKMKPEEIRPDVFPPKRPRK